MEWKQFASRVLAFSKTGLKYSKDPYALENYEELKTLALTQLDETNLIHDHAVLYPKDAYPTPNVSVRVIVFNDEGKLLMVQERDDERYTVPGGWCDVFESPKENAEKEVLQETGLKVKTTRLLAVFMRDRYKPRASMISEYVMYFEAKVIGGELQHNHETLHVDYYDLKNLPVLSFKTSAFELNTALEVSIQHKETYFD